MRSAHVLSINDVGDIAVSLLFFFPETHGLELTLSPQKQLFF